MTGVEVFCVCRKDRPDSLATVFLGIILPAEREAPAFGFDSQMLSIPSAKLLGIFRFEENPTDAGNFFHNLSPGLGCGQARACLYNKSCRARRVYSRVICLRQFITKSVLSSG